MRTLVNLFIIALASLVISARGEVVMLDEHASPGWARAVSAIHKDTDSKLTALDELAAVGGQNVDGPKQLKLRDEIIEVQDNADLVSHIADTVRHENAKILKRGRGEPMNAKREEARVVGKMLNGEKKNQQKEQAVTNDVLKNLDSLTGTKLGEVRGESLHTTPVDPVAQAAQATNAVANTNPEVREAVLEAAKWKEGQKLYQKIKQMGGLSKALKGPPETQLSKMEANMKQDERGEAQLELSIGNEIDAAGKEVNNWYNLKRTGVTDISAANSKEKSETDLGEAERSPAQMAQQIRDDAMKAIQKLESAATAAITKAATKPQVAPKPQAAVMTPAAKSAKPATALRHSVPHRAAPHPTLKHSVPHRAAPHPTLKHSMPHPKAIADTGAFLKMEGAVSEDMRKVKIQEKQIQQYEKKHLAEFDQIGRSA